MTKNEYNGWANYETWNVKLWLDNDQGSYSYWIERADQILSDHTQEVTSDEGRDNGGELAKEFDTDSAASDLAEALEAEVKDNAPDLGASCYSDLLNAALSEVNWHEIAASMIEDAKERATE